MSPRHPYERSTPHAGAVALRVGPIEVHDGDSVSVALRGELDLASAPELASGMAVLITPPAGGVVARQSRGTVLLDMSALTFLDTSGLAALTNACNALSTAGWRVCLSRPEPAVCRLLDLAVTAGWFPGGMDCGDDELPRQRRRAGVTEVRPGQGPA